MSETIAPAPAVSPEAATPVAPAPAQESLLGAPTAAPAPEGAPATGQPAEAAPAPAEPIQYGEFKVPEGMQVDTAGLEQFKGIASELRIPQDKAQELVSLYASRIQEAQVQSAQAQRQQAEAMVAAVKADPEIGGPKLQATLQHAAVAIDKFGGPELKAALNQTGAGNHPEIIRFFNRIGQALSESSFVPGNQVAPQQITRDLVAQNPAKFAYPELYAKSHRNE